jgi:hypothetical protein
MVPGAVKVRAGVIGIASYPDHEQHAYGIFAARLPVDSSLTSCTGVDAMRAIGEPTKGEAAWNSQ